MTLNTELLPNRPNPIVIEPNNYQPVSGIYRSTLIAAIVLTIMAITEILTGIFVDGLYTFRPLYGAIQYPGWFMGAMTALIALLAWQAVFNAKKPQPRVWSLFEALEYEDGFDIVCEALDLDRKKLGLEVDLLTVNKGGVLELNVSLAGKEHQSRKLPLETATDRKLYVFALKYMDKVKSARFDARDLSDVSIERLRALADRYNVTLKLTGEAGSLSKKEEDAVIPKVSWRYWGLTSLVFGIFAFRYNWFMPLPTAFIAIGTGLIGLIKAKQLPQYRTMSVLGIMFAIGAILQIIEQQLYK